MTACTNHGGKARRVVTAALVGVLSVGTVPMVALAEGVNDAVSPLFATGDELTNGTVENLAFKTFNGNEWVAVGDQFVGEDAEGNVTVNANQLPVRPDIEKVVLAGGAKTETVTSATVSNYKIRLYRADEKGEPTGTPLSGNKAVDAGEYVVTITALSGSAFEGQTFKTSFIVVGEKLPDATAYEGTNKTDTRFIYTGSDLDVNFRFAGGAELVEGVDYTVSYMVGSKVVDSVEGVGTYTAVLTGMGKYAGSTATTSVVVNPFLVSQNSVTVEIDPFTKDSIPTTPSRVYYTDGSGNKTYLDPSLVNVSPSAGETVNDETTTPYKFDVTVSNDVLAQGNVTWTKGATKTTTGVMVDKIVDFSYNGSALQDSYELDASAGQKFNTAAITASWGRGSLTVPDAQVTVDKVGGEEPAVDDKTDLKNGVFGEYTVTVKVDAANDDNGTPSKAADDVVYAGAKTFTVKIYKGIVNVDEALYVYAPDRTASITSYAKGYDGETMTERYFEVYGTTTTGEKLTTADIQRKLVDAEGNKVQSATDAGEYKLVVTSDWYKLQNGDTELPVTVAKVDLGTVKIGEVEKWNDVAGQEYLPSDKDYEVSFVDNAIKNLALKYDTGVEGDDIELTPADNSTWTDFSGWDILPSNVDVDVEYNDEGTWKPVGEIEEDASGQYRVTLTVAEDVAANYVLPEGETSVTIEFTVAKKGSFSDVQPSDWYYEAVNKAANNKYMNGYAGTTTFGAEDNLTRAQAVIVLFNMSGFKDNATTGSNETGMEYNVNTGWVTGFDDVDGFAYYAQAVAWAKNTGVVNGNGGKFMPEDEITREQFAAMLSNYAKVVNRDETVDSADQSVLADFADANTVSDWAKGAVAWAVSATEDRDPIMGKNGSIMGQNKITRGEVAAMVTDYQPVDKGGNTAR